VISRKIAQGDLELHLLVGVGPPDGPDELVVVDGRPVLGEALRQPVPPDRRLQ